MDLIILPELRDHIPPMSNEEFALLEESCLREGILDDLTIWETEGKSILTDGFHREKISRKHNLPFNVRAKEFKDIEEVKAWMRLNQRGRRNASSSLKKYLKAHDNPDHRQMSLFKSGIDKVIEAVGAVGANLIFHDKIERLSANDIRKFDSMSEVEIQNYFEPIIKNKAKSLQSAKTLVKSQSIKPLKDWQILMAQYQHEGHSTLDSYQKARKDVTKVEASKNLANINYREYLLHLIIANPISPFHLNIAGVHADFLNNHKITAFEAYRSYVVSNPMVGGINNILLLRDLYYFMELIQSEKFKSNVVIHLNEYYDKAKSLDSHQLRGIDMNEIKNIIKENISVQKH